MDQEAARRVQAFPYHTGGGQSEGNAETQPNTDHCTDPPGAQWTNVLRPLARSLLRLSDYIGTPAHKRYDDSSFQMGQANAFPEIPAERGRVRELDQIQNQWRDPTPVATSQRSRAGSGASKEGVEHIEGSSQRRASSHHRRGTGDTLRLPSPTRTRSRTMSSAPLGRIITSGSQYSPAIVISPVEIVSSHLGELSSAPSDLPSPLSGG